MSRRRFLVVAMATSLLLGVGCRSSSPPRRPATATSGDAGIGRELIADYGCGSCHQVPGVRGADGLVGPPLSEMGLRSFIAGQLANNEDNMIRWLMDPQAVEPGTAMPDLDVSEQDARNIAAYLAGLD